MSTGTPVHPSASSKSVKLEKLSFDAQLSSNDGPALARDPSTVPPTPPGGTTSDFPQSPILDSQVIASTPSNVGLQRVLLLQALAQRQREILAISTQLVAESAATSPPSTGNTGEFPSQHVARESDPSSELSLGPQSIPSPSEKLHHSIKNSSSIHTLHGQLALLPESERASYAKLMSTNWSSVLEAMNSNTNTSSSGSSASSINEATSKTILSETPISSSASSSRDEIRSPDEHHGNLWNSSALQYAFNVVPSPSSGKSGRAFTPSNASELLLAQQQLDEWTKTVFLGSQGGSPLSAPSPRTSTADMLLPDRNQTTHPGPPLQLRENQPHPPLHPVTSSSASSEMDWSSFFSSPPFSAVSSNSLYSDAVFDSTSQLRSTSGLVHQSSAADAVASTSSLSHGFISNDLPAQKGIVSSLPLHTTPHLRSLTEPGPEHQRSFSNDFRAAGLHDVAAPSSSSHYLFGGNTHRKDLGGKGRSASIMSEPENGGGLVVGPSSLTGGTTNGVNAQCSQSGGGATGWGPGGSETGTPDDTEEDKRRRNTEASARFRAKKKQRDAALQQSSAQLRQRILELEQVKGGLQKENKWLKELIKEKGEVDKLIARASVEDMGDAERDDEDYT